MSIIGRWKVIWGVALLAGLAWEPAPVPRGNTQSCPSPVVWADGSSERQLCRFDELRNVLTGCRVAGSIYPGTYLRAQRTAAGCVVRATRLAAAHRLRMGERLDINGETVRALTAVDGIGLATAKKIVKHRPYRRIRELLRIRGIGVKRLALLRPSLRVKPSRRLWPPSQPSLPRGASILREP